MVFPRTAALALKTRSQCGQLRISTAALPRQCRRSSRASPTAGMLSARSSEVLGFPARQGRREEVPRNRFHRMPDVPPIYDDPGTILDSSDRLQGKVAAARPLKPDHPGGLAEVPYRSPHRWAAPRLLICDEASLDEGEIRYLRSDRIVIGRVHGDVVIGHDSTMSSRHTEIIRADVGGTRGWVLRDLESSNGTLARVRSVTLRSGMGILIGSRRFRFDTPSPTPASSGPFTEPDTVLVGDAMAVPVEMLPALVESSTRGLPDGARHPLRKSRNTIGRPRSGNDIELEDECLAARHAVITRDTGGAWQLQALPSLNGVWVQIPWVRLTHDCLFQCGEQRFRWWA